MSFQQARAVNLIINILFNVYVFSFALGFSVRQRGTFLYPLLKISLESVNIPILVNTIVSPHSPYRFHM